MNSAALGYLLDLDGTLVAGNRLLPGAAAFVADAADRCAVVSNDAEHLPEEVARKLHRLGASIPAERIVLAGALGLERLAHADTGARTLVLASPGLQRYARDLGLGTAGKEVDVVFLGRDRSFGFEALARAANAVRLGARLVVANPDLNHPGSDGGVVPETGALLQALLACAGSVPYEVVGKPEPHLFTAGLARLGLRPDQAVMLGDNPTTDGLGARRLGMPYIRIGPDRPLCAGMVEGRFMDAMETLG